MSPEVMPLMRAVMSLAALCPVFQRVTWDAARIAWIEIACAAESVKACAMGVIVCLVAIPWKYVWVKFVREPGDRWW